MGSPIVSFAILQTNWEKDGNKDYLDNFLLLVVEAIKHISGDLVTLSNLQEVLLGQFSLRIPQSTIKILLERANKRHYVYVKNNLYHKAKDLIEENNFQEVQHRVLEAHQNLINQLINFVHSRYEIIWAEEQANTALTKYLEENEIRLLDLEHSESIVYKESTNRTNLFLVAEFVNFLRNSKTIGLQYLELIVKGSILANFLFFTRVGAEAEKFKNVTFYLDAPLVIKFLGYAGEPRRTPISEMIELVKKHNGRLAIFNHSVREIEGILANCCERIREKKYQSLPGTVLEYFIQNEYSESHVMLFLQTLRETLNNNQIQIVEVPEYDNHQLVIDEIEFSNHIKTIINYTYDHSLQNDVDSICAIFRLRSSNKYVKYEITPAFFLSENPKLILASRTYHEIALRPEFVPLCMTDFEITTLLWLKNPDLASNLPNSILIADAYACVQPTQELWNKYIQAVEGLKNKREISEKEVYILTHSIQAKSILMDVTLGQTSALTEATVGEMMKLVEAEIKKDAEEKLAQSEKEKAHILDISDSKSKEANDYLERIQSHNNRINGKIIIDSKNIAKIVLGIISFVILGFTVGIGFIQVVGFKSNNPFFAIVLVFLALLWVILEAIEFIFGVGPKFIREIILPKIEQKIIKKKIEKARFNGDFIDGSSLGFGTEQLENSSSETKKGQ